MVTRTRPSRSDGEATRKRILNSAGDLIADRGYAETTGKAIAARAGVDLASINYHFGSRDGLYRAVLIEAHRRFVQLDALEDITAKEISPDDKLRDLLRVILTNVGSLEDWSVGVLVRELSSPSSHFSVLQRDEITPSFDVALQIISEITGIPGDDPALFYCLLSSVAPCLMLTLSGTAMVASGRPRLRAAELLDHMHRFALAGLESAAASYRARS